jgi:iron(III) transport system permease protein
MSLKTADRASATSLHIDKGRGASLSALNLAVGVVLAITLIPFIYIALRAFEKPLPEILDLLLRAKTLQVLATTTALLLIVVAVNIIVGTLMAAGLHFIRLPKAHLFILPTILPLAIPSYVFTYTWLALVPSLSGLFAAAFILILTTMPYMLLAILVSLRRIDGSLIEVARTLGLSRFKIFIRVILPQIRSSISAGALLSGLYVLSDFGAVSLLNVETLTVSIQNMFKASYDRSAASVISILLILASVLFIAFNERLKDSDNKENISKRLMAKNIRINNSGLKVS